MSRNKNRIKVPQQIKQTSPAPPPQIKPQHDNPFGLSFVVPTEIVKLPSGGHLYDDGNPLKGVSEIEVKAVTAAEEDIMINDSFIQKGIVFDKLIDAIMVTPGIRAHHLMDCDKIAILMCARKTGYGDLVDFGVSCINCGHDYEMSVSLTNLLESTAANAYSPSSGGDEWDYHPDSNTFSFNLPTTGLPVNIRLLSPEDNRQLDNARKQKEKLNLPFNETIEFIRATLVSAQGITDRSSINKLSEFLPAADARKIRLIHNKNLPKIQNTQETTCPNCGHKHQKEVPFSLGWFWS